MHILSYLIIFVLKIVENGLGTLRTIFVAGGRKGIGALLNFAIALTWVISTGMVVININEDPIKVIVFAFGCYLGSYYGCVLEEKIALGNNIIMCITSNDISSKLRELGYPVTITKCMGINNDNYILYIAIRRKRKDHLIKKIIELDSNSMIISECANIVYGGHLV